MLIERGRWRSARRLSAQVVAEMEKLKFHTQAQALSAWLQQRMLGMPEASAPESIPPAGRPRLPLKCPSCGGSVNPEEVEWLDDKTAECAYCGSAIRAEGASPWRFNGSIALTAEEMSELLKRPAAPLYSERALAGSLFPEGEARCAAVLIPLLRSKGEWQVLFIRRTDTVQEHKGQVAFPGGGCEPQDKNQEETALREAQEEIGLQPQDVRILGRLPEFVTITNYSIAPFVGIFPWPYPLVMEPQEVDRIFTIPLGWLADPAHREVRSFVRNGQVHRDGVIYFQPYDGELLWGASARMMVDLLHTLQLA